MSYAALAHATSLTNVSMTRTELGAELERNHAASFGWTLACTGWDRTEAEEVLQIAYVRALDGSARFGGRSSVKTWFFGVIRRTAAGRRRTARLRRLALERFRGPVPTPIASPEEETDAGRDRARLRAALTRLSVRQREVLHLVFYGDLTVEEAARVMGVSVGSARTHYARGKTKLRELLAEGDAD